MRCWQGHWSKASLPSFPRGSPGTQHPTMAWPWLRTQAVVYSHSARFSGNVCGFHFSWLIINLMGKKTPLFLPAGGLGSGQQVTSSEQVWQKEFSQVDPSSSWTGLHPACVLPSEKSASPPGELGEGGTGGGAEITPVEEGGGPGSQSVTL